MDSASVDKDAQESVELLQFFWRDALVVSHGTFGLSSISWQSTTVPKPVSLHCCHMAFLLSIEGSQKHIPTVRVISERHCHASCYGLFA